MFCISSFIICSRVNSLFSIRNSWMFHVPTPHSHIKLTSYCCCCFYFHLFGLLCPFIYFMLWFCVQERDCSKELQKLSVKFFLHASGNIAAKFPYDTVQLDLVCFVCIYGIIFFLYLYFLHRYLWLLSGGYPKPVGMQKKGFLFPYSFFFHRECSISINFLLLAFAVSDKSENVQIMDVPFIFFVISWKDSMWNNWYQCWGDYLVISLAILLLVTIL